MPFSQFIPKRFVRKAANRIVPEGDPKKLPKPMSHVGMWISAIQTLVKEPITDFWITKDSAVFFTQHFTIEYGRMKN